MILKGIEVAVWNLPFFHTSENIARINYDVYVGIGKRIYVACNFNCRVENEELFKVTGNISVMTQDRDVVTTDQ